MKTTIALLFIWLAAGIADISMNGVRIGDTQKSLSKLKLKVEAQEENMIKFKTENGNDFSITSDEGKVVYMENDWLQDTNADKPLFSNFTFGKTTLKDIRKAYGNNGFTYASRGFFTTETDLIAFNCFEFDSKNNEILVVITKVPLDADVNEDNVAENLKLDALIIADKAYLDAVWGDEKVLDPNYKKIKP